MKKVLLLSLSLTLMLSPIAGAMVNPTVSKIKEPNPSATMLVKSNEFERLAPPFVRLALAKPVVKEVKQDSSADEELKVTATVMELEKKEAPKPQPIPVAKKEVSGKSRTFVATAYTANVESTGKHKGNSEYGVTASGEMVKANHTVSCPKSLPFGTKMYIPSLNNTFTCEDRGSKITEGHLDIYIPKLQDALDFGRQKLEVIILSSEM